MDRRDFLAATAGALILPDIACSSVTHNVPGRALTDVEADEILARLDASLAATGDTRFVSEVVAEVLGESVSPAQYEAADALADLAIRALIIGDAGGLVPRGVAPPAGLVERFAAYAPELGEAVISQTALFERTPLRAKQHIDEAMRAEGGIAMRVGEVLDTHARRTGVSSSGLGKMRRILVDLDARSRSQAFSVVTDEVVTKVRHVAAVRGDEAALAHAIDLNVAASAFWSQVAPSQTAAANADVAPRTTSTVSTPRLRAPLSPEERRARYERGGTLELAGGVMGGLGAVMWGLGWGFGVAGGINHANWGLVIGGTVGAVAAITGLVLLIVGGVLRSRYGDS